MEKYYSSSYFYLQIGFERTRKTTNWKLDILGSGYGFVPKLFGLRQVTKTCSVSLMTFLRDAIVIISIDNRRGDAKSSQDLGLACTVAPSGSILEWRWERGRSRVLSLKSDGLGSSPSLVTYHLYPNRPHLYVPPFPHL